MQEQRDPNPTPIHPPNLATNAEDGHTALRIDVRNLLWSILLNAAVPVGVYRVMKRFVSPSELHALLAASVFPLVYSIAEFVRHRSFDLIAIFALLSIVVGLIGVALGGSAKLLLIRESFFTGLLGVACFVSLLLPRPLMFYVGRQLMAGSDPGKRAVFDDHWQYPYARFVHRVITTVWGIAYVGEFLLRVVLVYTLPTTLVLAVSPVLLGAVTIGAILWTITFVRHAETRGRAIRLQAAARRQEDGAGERG
jgi:hypothetical protein